MPYDPAIPFPGKTIMEKIHALLHSQQHYYTAKTWKQPRCPSTEEWIKKMWYIHTMEYYSAIKKKERMPFVGTKVDLEIIFVREKQI